MALKVRVFLSTYSTLKNVHQIDLEREDWHLALIHIMLCIVESRDVGRSENLKLQIINPRLYKVWTIENNTNLYSIFCLIKSSRIDFFLPAFSHDITKEFWKNSHFENMRAAFLLRCQNSLRWGKSSICHWNIDSWKQKLSFGWVMVPKNNQNII